MREKCHNYEHIMTLEMNFFIDGYQYKSWCYFTKADDVFSFSIFCVIAHSAEFMNKFITCNCICFQKDQKEPERFMPGQMRSHS